MADKQATPRNSDESQGTPEQAPSTETAAPAETGVSPDAPSEAPPSVEPPPPPVPGTHYRSTIFPPQLLPKEFGLAVRKLEEMFGRPMRFLFSLDDGPMSKISPDLVQRMIISERAPKNDRGVGLVIQSPGGDGGSSYRLARFLQRRFGSFISIVPHFAKSASTLISLGADQIYLGPNAELGPLDVQIFEPAEREAPYSALDEVQALERLHESALSASINSVMTLKIITRKKYDVLFPMCLTFVADMWRPLFEKIDVVHWTKMARALKVGEDYAIRLLRKNHDEMDAALIAEALVKKYPEHGFVIDLQEAQNLADGPTGKIGLPVQELSGDACKLLSQMQASLRRAGISAVVGEVLEVTHDKTKGATDASNEC